MSPRPAPDPDVARHDLGWMLSDALGLLHLGRRAAAVLLLLSAADALARRALPPTTRVGDRFRRLVRDRLPAAEWPAAQVPAPGGPVRVEDVLYAFLRNPALDGEAAADIGRPAGWSAGLDWADGAPPVAVAGAGRVIRLGGRPLVARLAAVVKECLAEELVRATRAPSRHLRPVAS